jgi:uracil-DNA glycosylase family 4
MEIVSVRMSAEGCQLCPLARTRDKVVFGGVDGYRDIAADLMIVGEAPGAEEDAAGLPFVGAAGQKLDVLLAEAGLGRKSAYITNVVKCRPIKEPEGRHRTNRAPEPMEIAACWNYLESQINLVRPRVIVALGVTAVARLLGPGAEVGASRGRGHSHGSIPVVATYHPSPLSLHRQPGRRAMVLEDLSLAKRLLDGQEDPLLWAHGAV